MNESKKNRNNSKAVPRNMKIKVEFPDISCVNTVINENIDIGNARVKIEKEEVKEKTVEKASAIDDGVEWTVLWHCDLKMRLAKIGSAAEIASKVEEKLRLAEIQKRKKAQKSKRSNRATKK